MLINLRVLDSKTGSFFETEAVLMGNGCAVYNDGGSLSIKPVVQVNGGFQTELNGKTGDFFSDDLSIIEKISEMAALDYIELCQ